MGIFCLYFSCLFLHLEKKLAKNLKYLQLVITEQNQNLTLSATIFGLNKKK